MGLVLAQFDGRASGSRAPARTIYFFRVRTPETRKPGLPPPYQIGPHGQFPIFQSLPICHIFRYVEHMEIITEGRIVASNYGAKVGAGLIRVVVCWHIEQV